MIGKSVSNTPRLKHWTELGVTALGKAQRPWPHSPITPSDIYEATIFGHHSLLRMVVSSSLLHSKFFRSFCHWQTTIQSQIRKRFWETQLQDLEWNDWWAIKFITYNIAYGFPEGSVVKNLPANSGDLGSIPGLERSPGGGKVYQLQYSGLEKSMDYSPWGCKESDTTEQHSLHFTSSVHIIMFLSQVTVIPGVLR